MGVLGVPRVSDSPHLQELAVTPPGRAQLLVGQRPHLWGRLVVCWALGWQ